MKFFNNGWDAALEDEFEKPYFKQLLQAQPNTITLRTMMKDLKLPLVRATQIIIRTVIRRTL